MARRAGGPTPRAALRFLAEAGAALGSSLDSGAILQQVARLAVPVLADWCLVDLATATVGFDTLPAAPADPARVALLRTLRHCYSTALDGAAALVSDLPRRAPDAPAGALLRALGVQSCVIAPLIARERMLGALALGAAAPGRRFGRADLRLAEDLARLVALAIDNAALYRAEQAARAAAERAAGHAARLQAITAALAEARSREEVATVVVEQGVAALGAYAGALALLADDGAALQIIRSVGYAADTIERWRRLPLAIRTPLSEALETGEAVWLETASAFYARYPAVATERAAATGALAVVPLAVRGHTLGGMALSFREERAFPADERAFIQALVGQCAQALERALLDDAERQARAEIEEARRRLTEAQQIAHLGSWQWDLVSGAVAWSDEMYRLFGLEVGQIVPTFEQVLEYVHPDDRARVRTTIEGGLGRGAPIELEYRIVRPDGAIRVLHSRANVFSDASGRPVRTAGTVLDITEQQQAEQEHAQVARLEGVLLTARTIAHRINNQLALTVGYADLLASDPRLPPAAQTLATEALAGAQAAAQTLAHLQRVARLEEVFETDRAVLDLERGLPPSS